MKYNITTENIFKHYKLVQKTKEIIKIHLFVIINTIECVTLKLYKINKICLNQINFIFYGI